MQRGGSEDTQKEQDQQPGKFLDLGSRNGPERQKSKGERISRQERLTVWMDATQVRQGLKAQI